MERDAPQNPGSGSDAGSQQPSSADGSSSSHYQFDWLNWFYWSMWWQQYSYWARFQNPSNQSWDSTAQPQGQQRQPGAASSTGDQQQWAPQGNPYMYQYNPYNPYYQLNNNPAVAPPWANGYQGQPHLEGGVAQPQGPGNLLTLRIRIINGFETYIAAAWKRLVAEVVDTALFVLLLKAYLPDADLRIPEVLFEGSDVWAAIEEEEDIEELQKVLSVFIFSVVVQRVHHAVMESLWLSIFACTPGKWLMGLRVLRCSSVHLTRTQPGRTVRVVPGGRMTPTTAILRSVFKAVFSLFCPLVIFFFNLNCGRTKYDKVFRCAVVDARTLFRPVYASRGQSAPGFGAQMRQ